MSSSDLLHYPRVDLELARRLERAEVLTTVAYVEARRSLRRSCGADWREIRGVHAVFDGRESPLTQSFGLGAFEPPSDAALEALEAFFAERGASTAHEVSALAAPVTWERLSVRGYSPIEASTVLVRPTQPTPRAEPGSITARVIEPDEVSRWSQVMVEGLSSESAELAKVVAELAPVMAHSVGARCFVAELEGRPVAAGVLSLQHDVAVLGGASTIPAARRQGAQAALLQARLEYASKLGVELAMVVAGPGSGSQRNAERKGFRPVYVRSKWLLAARETP